MKPDLIKMIQQRLGVDRKEAERLAGFPTGSELSAEDFFKLNMLLNPWDKFCFYSLRFDGGDNNPSHSFSSLALFSWLWEQPNLYHHPCTLQNLSAL